MNWDSAVNIQIALIALLSALLAVLAAEVTRLRTSVDEWQKTMNRVGEALLKVESHAHKLKQTEEDQRNAAARQLVETAARQPADARDAAGRAEQAPPATLPEPPALNRDVRELQTNEEVQRVAPPSYGSGSGRDLEKVSRQLYQEWCANDERPFARDGVDIGYLRYAGDQRTSELSPPMHVFSDDPQIGEFVRFSFPGSESGLAFPNPEAFFNARVHHILFPGLTKEYLDNHRQLANTRPVPVRRQGDGLWQKA